MDKLLNQPEIKTQEGYGWYISKWVSADRCLYLHGDGEWHSSCASGWYKSKYEAEGLLNKHSGLKIGDEVEVLYDCTSKGKRGKLITMPPNGNFIVTIEGKRESFSYRTSLKKVTDEVKTVKPEEQMFCNHYFCDDCDLDWESEWDCECDDKCASCNTAYTPYYSEDITGEI